MRLCSTPFGITDYIGHHAVPDAGPRDDVLNAFRHHGLYRADRRARHPHGHVLNAFRHHGLYRARAEPRTAAWSSAQRLSASRIISDGGHRMGVAMAGCSTPFGITDYIGLSTAAVARSTVMICAQRLSASRIISDRHPPVEHNGSVMCSTPFGITDYIGGCAWQTPRDRGVLNAFRHHGLYRRQ